ncbi:hypothetical protein HZC21_03940 [Candidatus Peregrinibacteria bacterium]|nr:hypothetical protein [Candidatus Peregrinibacteria bacterium]
MVKTKHSDNVRKVKHFLLGAGLVLTLVASTSFVQTLAQSSETEFPCASLDGQMATFAKCDAADAAKTGSAPTTGQLQPLLQPAPCITPSGVPCSSFGASQPMNLQQGQFLQPMQPTNLQPMSLQQNQFSPQPINLQQMQQSMQQQMQQGQQSQFGQQALPSSINPQQRLSVLESALQSGQLTSASIIFCHPIGKEVTADVCLKAVKGFVSGTSSQPQQFGQEQATQPTIITPTVKTSNVTLASKGLKLELKMQSSLNSKYRKAKGRTKKLAAVRTIAKQLPTLCKYIGSGDFEEDLDEDAFDCDAFVAELSEPIADALEAKDYEIAYESTITALESFGQIFTQESE